MLIYMLMVFLAIYILGTCVPEITVIHRLTFENSIWVFYFILGYCLSLQRDFLQSHHRVIELTFFVLLCCHIGLRLFGIGNDFLDMALYIAFFTLLLSMKFSKEYRVVKEISRMSYGIYLSHFMIISVLLKLNVFQNIPLLIEPLCMLVTVLLLDMAALYVLEKMRFKKYIM